MRKSASASKTSFWLSNCMLNLNRTVALPVIYTFNVFLYCCVVFFYTRFIVGLFSMTIGKMEKGTPLD